ncbi:hypothetical protein B0T22DRAFT_478288 [Podospora appendiculata]|uniref:NACHT domain-containing protein n=1 Tax=Podospora appendiculata TaxID=314037 RepID=A0AAE0XLH6_9PEZI|nr:hypothetical protein B0T22DRAFT_478288 [Podospora appendiculata]
MDPLAVLSIAAAVAQFIDFTAGVISAGSGIFRSAKGAAADNLALEAVCSNLVALGDQLDIAIDARGLSHSARGLKQLSAQCKSDCNELLTLLDKVKVQVGSAGPQRLWKSIKAGLGTAWNARVIQDFEKRLERAQRLMVLHVGSFVSDQVASLDDTLRAMDRDSMRMQIDQSSKLDNISKGLQDLRLDLTTQSGADTGNLNAPKILQRVAPPQLPISAGSPPRYSRGTRPNVSLVFTSVLSDWLHSGSGIFWVFGRAGSGKSTLMKFLADEPGTCEALVQWAEPKQAVIVAHYFWSAGTPMQRSQHGLLQSLLSMVLSELNSALSAIAVHQGLPAKFCFIIDGLNEFEGDHFDLCAALSNLAQSPNFKLHSLPIDIYGYHDNEYRDPDYAIKWPVSLLSDSETARFLSRTRRQINARSNGLLEVRIERVEFLHRSVRDFLRTEEMHSYLVAKARPQFDAAHSIVRAQVAMIKSWDFTGHPTGDRTQERSMSMYGDQGSAVDRFKGSKRGQIINRINECFMHASRVKEQNLEQVAELLDELERSLEEMFLKGQAAFLCGECPPRLLVREQALLSMCYPYIARKLTMALPDDYFGIFKAPPLYVSSHLEEPPADTMIQLLLDHGLDPNEISTEIPESTPWLALVCCFHFVWDGRIVAVNVALRAGVYSAFLAKNADPNAVQPSDGVSTFGLYLLASLTEDPFFRESEAYLRTMDDFLDAVIEKLISRGFFDTVLYASKLMAAIRDSQEVLPAATMRLFINILFERGVHAVSSTGGFEVHLPTPEIA